MLFFDTYLYRDDDIDAIFYQQQQQRIENNNPKLKKSSITYLVLKLKENWEIVNDQLRKRWFLVDEKFMVVVLCVIGVNIHIWHNEIAQDIALQVSLFVNVCEGSWPNSLKKSSYFVFLSKRIFVRKKATIFSQKLENTLVEIKLFLRKNHRHSSRTSANDV